MEMTKAYAQAGYGVGTAEGQIGAQDWPPSTVVDTTLNSLSHVYEVAINLRNRLETVRAKAFGPRPEAGGHKQTVAMGSMGLQSALAGKLADIDAVLSEAADLLGTVEAFI